MGSFWIDADDFAVVGDAAVEFALVDEGAAAVVQGADVLRVEAERLVEVRNGALEVALEIVGPAAGDPCRTRAWD